MQFDFTGAIYFGAPYEMVMFNHKIKSTNFIGICCFKFEVFGVLIAFIRRFVVGKFECC